MSDCIGHRTEPGRTTAPVQLPLDVAKQVRVIAAVRGQTHAEVLVPLVRRDELSRQFAAAVAEAAAAFESQGG